jgi:hypothetical protein
MRKELAGIAEHMKELGLASLSHALQHTFYFDQFNLYWNDLAVLQAAHAAEILIKARIAEEHPLLIFTELPRSTQTGGAQIDIKALIESGRTLQFQDLPEKLWATTGYTIQDMVLYQRFGKLRNSIQHFASPDESELAQEILKFIFGIVDPMIHDFWGLYAVNYVEDPDAHSHIFPMLIKSGVAFLIPQDCEETVAEERARLRLGIYN